MLSLPLHHVLIRWLISALAIVATVAPIGLSQVAAQSDDRFPGDWSVTVTPGDAKDDVANSDMLVGLWRLTFGEGGVYTAERNDLGVLISGTWEIDGDELTVTDEAGLMSCSEAGNSGDGTLDVATGIYRVVEDEDDAFRLEVVEDGCRLRVVLLTASSLTPFVPCPVVSTGLAALDGAGQTVYEPADGALDGTIDEQIDRFLDELTACWATGDPARFLPLLTDEYQVAFLSAGTDEEEDPSRQARALATAMGIEFTFTRAGDIREVREDEATCIVRTVIGGQESLGRYRFVFIEGAWYWDGPA
jgi:hypothetical protein